MLVDLNSSPTTAQFCGTLIGSISLYIPVFIFKVICGDAFAGTLFTLPAVIASDESVIKVSMSADTVASDTLVKSETCKVVPCDGV